MSGEKGREPAPGQLNRGQVITMYGPGAMVDMVRDAVLVAGLDYWRFEKHKIKTIGDERLMRHLRDRFDIKGLTLREPPLAREDAKARVGLNVFVFPQWFAAQIDRFETIEGKTYRARPLFQLKEVEKGKVTFEGQRYRVTPVRFVQACENGHLSDIDWVWFLFQDKAPEHRKHRLWLDEGGSGNDLTEVFIRCQYPFLRRCLGEAAIAESRVLGPCRGERPWLGYRAGESCDKGNRLLLRGASNAYFSKTVTAISIPEQESALRQVVQELYGSLLAKLENKTRLQSLLDLTMNITDALQGYDTDEIWDEILKYRGQAPLSQRRSLKAEELDTLLAQPFEAGGERPDMGPDDANPEPFLARARRLDDLPGWLKGKLDRIVLVHRLREVIVQVGFTRFAPDKPDINGEHGDTKAQVLAPDLKQLGWLPAVENQGEGVFLSFKKEAVEAWLARDAVKARVAQLREGHQAWCARHEPMTMPDPAYYMLHSLSHLLITSVSLECGYSATAIKERIYVDEGRYGILLYTWSPATEGTLGGLIEVGRRIERSLEYALMISEFCSNDPVCAYHKPANKNEERFLHGAACHGCLLIAETCCEQGNDLLDRALVTPTVETPDAAFFQQIHGVEDRPS